MADAGVALPAETGYRLCFSVMGSLVRQRIVFSRNENVTIRIQVGFR